MNGLAYTGFGISLVGAMLDFYSGYSYWTGSMGSAEPMTGATPGYALTVALLSLGFAVLVGGVMMALPGMVGKMRRLGLLMEALGVVMALTSYLVPGMDLAVSYAMLFVGAAMIVNGAMMQRRAGATGRM